MDIGVFGATGTIGRAVLAEAGGRGHRVTAFTRDRSRFPADPGAVTWKVADVVDADEAAGAIGGLDVIVNAVNAGKDIPDHIANADTLPAAARALLRALERHPATRLIVVGGGGSLEVAPGKRIIDDEEVFADVLAELRVPPEYRKVVLAHAEVLDLCRLSNRYWTYLSPSAGRVDPGERTGRYRVGGDQVLPAADGDISAEDLAVALVDEVEIPRYVQRRFTVGR